LRSTWPLERSLGLVAAASLEAAWLTLAYLLVQWLAGARGVHLGIVAFAAAAALGLLLARAARAWPRGRYAGALVGASVAAAGIGTFLIGVPPTPPGAAPPVFAAHAGGWLLGLAVWRGTLHAELGDEAELSETVIRGGVPGLIAFWVVATASRMVGSDDYAAPAYVATVVFVGAGLLSLGLARLADLEVEAMDRGARRRWVTLLLAVSGLVLLLALPFASLLGVPVTRSIEAIAGPLAPLLLQLFLLLVIPFSLLAQLLADFLRAVLAPRDGSLLPSPPPDALPSLAPGDQLPQGVLDLSWLGIVAILAVVVVALMIVAALARPPGTPRRARRFDEVREPEPMDLQLPLHLPKVRLPRLRRQEPRTAVDAYRYALAALAPTGDGRTPTETPREHARRLRPPHGADIRRLAADFQLVVFADAALTPAEERRAIGRWRRIARSTRRRARRSGGPRPSS
jgi:hypothetical protein